MKNSELLFLQAVKAALNCEQVSWDQDISGQDWAEIFSLAEAHRMLPMVYQAAYTCPAAQHVDKAMMSYYHIGSIQMVALQTWKTAQFLPILDALRTAGVQPLLVKGITCRELYPQPDYRLSNDEDILIPPEHNALAHQILTDFGLLAMGEEGVGYETGYRSADGSIYLEIHRSLFPEDSTAYGDMNRFFRDVRTRAVEQHGIPTLHPTDHMLYLLCHAFKHFLHSGFGMRQVCDLILYANTYGQEVDWIYVLDSCRQIRAEHFAAGLFRIGWRYLNFSLECSRLPLQWQMIYVDETDLLEDILSAGVYGKSDIDRIHSSSITLNAVSSQKQGRSNAGSLIKTIFPPMKSMKSKYPYLKEKPLLLPIAWTDRIIKYGKSEGSPSGSLRIGSDRIELLRKYGVLDQ